MYIMFRNILIISLLGGLGCNQLDEKFGKNTESKEVSYSYACLDSTLGGKTINRRIEQAGELLRDLGVSEKSITDSVQTAYGQMFHKQMTEEGGFKLMNDKTLYNNLINTVRSANILLDDLRVHPKRYVNISVFGRKDKSGPLMAPLNDSLPK